MATSEKPGVIYVGHLPHGFYEEQIRRYFTQFGIVYKVRLARSKKTGGCKGYGYVQFASSEIAKIAAQTMNNYLMFDKLLKCLFCTINEPSAICLRILGDYVEPERLHKDTFKGHSRIFRKPIMGVINATRHNRKKDEKSENKQKKRWSKQMVKKRKQLKKLGISYELPTIDLKLEPDLKSEVKDEPKASRMEMDQSANVSSVFASDATLESFYIDSEDDEVTFKTPPNTIKRSLKTKMLDDDLKEETI